MTKLIPKIPTIWEQLPQSPYEASKAQIEIIRNSQDVEFFIEYLKDQKKWRFPRVSFDTFLDDKRYLGIGKLVYPKVRELGNDILHGGYTEAVIVAGIGGGKTLLSNLLACYKAHELLCYRNPHETFKLIKDKPITLMNMGTTATQALEVGFAGIRSYIQKSPWFMSFNPHILGSSIKFLENNILLLAGNSKSTTPLGYNVFNATLDEAAFYLDNDNKQVAEEIYMALQRRIVSRFPGKGLLVMISSPLYEGDFVMVKLKEARGMKDLIYSAQMPTWKLKPYSEGYHKDKFYFNARQSLIIKEEPKDKSTICRLDDEFDMYKEVWEIPDEFKKSFLQDPDKAKRDFAAVPSKAVMAFMPHREIVEKMFTEEVNPVKAGDKYVFPEAALRCNYYIHIDLALNKKGKGDFAGFAMCHFGGWKENVITGERHKTVVVDLAERIGAGPTGEIAFSDVRNKVYALKAMGYSIKVVSLDSYQCLRSGTKIPIVSLDSFQSSMYNKDNINNQEDMSLQNSSKIPLLTGKEKSIEDLKVGEYTYSINKHGDIGFGKIKNVWCSGKKDIYRVYLDSGKFVDCSGNHPFMLRDGSYTRADKLTEGTSLMPLYRKEGMADLKDYEMILHPRGKWEYTHRAVMRQKKEIERGKVIHHKDIDKLNNAPNNLESLTYKEHGILHGDLGRKGLIIAREALSKNPEALARKNKALGETAKRRWKEDPEGMKEMLSKGNKKRWSKKGEHEKMSKRCVERNILTKPRLGTITSEQGKKNISEAGKKIWQDPKHREKMMLRDTAHYGKDHPQYDESLTVDILQKHADKKLVAVCKLLNVKPGKVRSRIKTKGFRTWAEFCSSYNHKVLKVEKLGIQDDTWDIEIEGLHNFAVGAGVFVHNSKDTLQLLRSKGLRSEYLSVDRTIEPYQTLKEMIYSERIKCHEMPVLLEELAGLEITKANKVDHRPGSSKDVADAVCGAVFNCVQDTGGEIGMSAGSFFAVKPGETPASMIKSEKEKHYERLQMLSDKGLLG